MDSRDLKAFLLLSETLHFGQAAQLASVSPSALSRTIQRLEAELDCRLFDRNNREVRLTQQGRVLQAQARELLERMQALRGQVRADSRALQGSVSLYCSVTASYSLLAGLLPEFRARHPGVEINLHTGDEASALGRVVQGREDMAIAARPDQLPANIGFLELATTPLVFIAPASSRFEQLAGAAPAADWAALPMILPETGQARERVDRWFAEKGLVPRVYAQVSGNEAIVSMVALGCGVGVVPQLVLKSNPFGDSVRLLELTPELHPFRIGLCCRKPMLANQLVAAFWSLAAEGAPRG
jgi:LysR family transcriptional regulator, positive regulator for ilvC